MTVTESLDQILATLNGVRADAVKFDNGNAAAGTRVRTAAQDAKAALQELRTLVQETKTARKP
jgi:hypothetical protein